MIKIVNSICRCHRKLNGKERYCLVLTELWGHLTKTRHGVFCTNPSLLVSTVGTNGDEAGKHKANEQQQQQQQQQQQRCANSFPLQPPVVHSCADDVSLPHLRLRSCTRLL